MCKVEIEKAIKLLANKVAENLNVSPDEALKYTQGALNLAHALNLLTTIETK